MVKSVKRPGRSGMDDLESAMPDWREDTESKVFSRRGKTGNGGLKSFGITMRIGRPGVFIRGGSQVEKQVESMD